MIWSTSVIAALGLTGALAMPIVAQPADSRQGDIPVTVGAFSDASLYHGPVMVSPDAPLNAFGASGKKIAIDGRPVGMLEGAAASSETSNGAQGSSALLAGTVGELGKLPGELQLMHPVKTRRISSPYGWRANPTGAGNQIHIGQDYPIACGSPVYAAEAGTVTVSAWAGHSGMRVTIDHGHNVQTGYSHNSKLLAKVGQQVQQGELIALAGTTGNSTGCHVHFEVIIDGRWHDPRNYLPVIPGQRQAMINSQRLTVNANSAPKGNGSTRPDNSSQAPDPDVVVPENDTPVIPSAKPSPSPVKPKSPTPSQSESPSGSKSPGGSQSPDGSESPGGSESPADSQSPDGSESPSETPTKPEGPSETSPPASESPTSSESSSGGGTTDSSEPTGEEQTTLPPTQSKSDAPASSSKEVPATKQGVTPSTSGSTDGAKQSLPSSARVSGSAAIE